MSDSKQFTRLIGPMLIAVTSSEMVNPGVWDAIFVPVTNQSGMLLLIAGLSIARVHNRWTERWPVVVTLIGGFCTLTGLGNFGEVVRFNFLTPILERRWTLTLNERAEGHPASKLPMQLHETIS